MRCVAYTRVGDRCLNTSFVDSGAGRCWIHLATDLIERAMQGTTVAAFVNTQRCVKLNKNGSRCWRWTSRREHSQAVCHNHRAL